MILVTGHMGFIGGHLMRALEHEHVDGIDIRDGRDILVCPLPDPEKVDRVYHLAAQTDALSTITDTVAAVNIMGTIRLLQIYRDRVVLASSSMVNYPVTPYAISKLAAEHYARYYGAAIVRFCNIYGDGGHSAWDRFASDEVIEVRGTGEQLRTYAHVSMAVEAMLAAKPGEMKVLHGETLTVNQLAAAHASLLEKPVRRVPAEPLDLMDARQCV